jgi:hypothetical protein
MPSTKYFDRCPEFPSDIPVADIPTISFQNLKDADEGESYKLFDACQDHGFFLLDLAGSSDGDNLLKDAEAMFDIGSETLSLDSETLNKYAYNPPKDLTGYTTFLALTRVSRSKYN